MAQENTLVLYVFSNTDPEYYANLLFFVEHGMPGCDECKYVVIINRDPGAPVRLWRKFLSRTDTHVASLQADSCIVLPLPSA